MKGCKVVLPSLHTGAQVGVGGQLCFYRLSLLASRQTQHILGSYDVILFHRSKAPPRRCSRRGRISGRPWHPKLTDSTAPMAPECQSFLDNVVARDRRHLIAELPWGNHSRETGSIATACLARSSTPLSPTTHSC